MPSGFSWTQLGVDPGRVEVVKEAPLGVGRRFVLYWCQVNHRAEQNHALDAAIALGNHLTLPVVCYQALRPDHPYASARLHAFVLDGLADFKAGLARRGIAYWLELPATPAAHVPRLRELGAQAAAVVSDLFPTFVVPGHLRAAAKRLDVPLFAVDASCVIPMRRIPSAQIGARTLRPKIHRLWPEYRHPLPDRPLHVPSLGGRSALTPSFAIEQHPERQRAALEGFSLSHPVAPVAGVMGGRQAALARLQAFVERSLVHFAEGHPPADSPHQSGLSPYLHFGHLFAAEAVRAAQAALGEKHPSVERFFEQLVVRRELGFNYCFYTPLPNQLSLASLPAWAVRTLDRHRKDPRPVLYDDFTLESGETDDPIWNAAQHELRERGTIHGYLRMLWGKKLLEWSATPEQALARIIRLNDTYALDGRDPVSVGNFMWIFGLHDRPFQERPILGQVRPMSSQRTAKKLDIRGYLRRFGSGDTADLFST